MTNYDKFFPNVKHLTSTFIPKQINHHAFYPNTLFVIGLASLLPTAVLAGQTLNVIFASDDFTLPKATRSSTTVAASLSPPRSVLSCMEISYLAMMWHGQIRREELGP